MIKIVFSGQEYSVLPMLLSYPESLVGLKKGQEWPFAPLETKGQLTGKKIPNQVLGSNSELNTVCFTIKTSSKSRLHRKFCL